MRWSKKHEFKRHTNAQHSTAQHSTAQHSTAQHNFKKYWLSFIGSSVIALASCGGGGGGSSSGAGSTAVTSSITGTAAVGSPIVGATVNVKCASSTALPSSTTSTVGGMSLTLTNQTFPCATQISGGTIDGVANTNTYHSIALSAGNVNATPLTDLLIANLAGTAAPSTWFANLTTAQLTAITQARVNSALTNLQNALGSTLPTSINPITTAFNPVAGVQMDDVLSALAKGITSNGTSHAGLLALAGGSAGASFTPPAGFQTAFASGFTKTLTGGGVPTVTSFSPSTVAVAGAITLTGTNLLPVTRVIFTGPAAGSNSSPTILSNIRTAGVLGSQTATSIAVTLPTNLVTGSYAVSIVHPGGEITAGGTVWVSIDGNPVVTLSAPATFTASGGSRKVSLSWTAVLGATGYNIYQSTSAGVSITWSSKVAPCQACISLDTPTISNGATTSFIDGKNTFNTAPGASGLLSSNTKYYYVIRAINNANLESPSSIEVSATTGP